MAADLCELYEEYCPGYFRNVVSGGSYFSFSDTFNVNPAAIPITETLLGVEMVATLSGTNSSGTQNFTLIKGFEGAGLGIANNTDETLYAYNLVQSFDGTEFKEVANATFSSEKTVMSSLNIGSAVALLPKNFFPLINSPTFGLNMRYNELTGKWDPQAGVSLNSALFTIGASYRKSKGRNTIDSYDWIPEITTITYNAGTKIGFLGIDYTLLYLKTPEALLQGYAFFNKPVRILSLLGDIDKLQFTYARREAYNILDSKIIRSFYGVQYKLFSKLTLGYNHNYVPGSNSLSIQWLF